jgi:hypothetical protein
MAKKRMLSEAQDTIVDTAKTGAEAVKNVATEAAGAAISAAATAAAGIVLTRAADALSAGKKKVEQAERAPPGSIQRAVGRQGSKQSRKSTGGKKRPAHQAAAKKSGSKKKPAAKAKSAKKKIAAKGKARSKGKSAKKAKNKGRRR